MATTRLSPSARPSTTTSRLTYSQEFQFNGQSFGDRLIWVTSASCLSASGGPDSGYAKLGWSRAGRPRRRPTARRRRSTWAQHHLRPVRPGAVRP
ncbi:hypothetical protein ACRAWD_30025 [Caulobacter segnis]